MARYIWKSRRVDEHQLWRRHAEGDERAREQLVDIYLPMARRMAKRYAGVREPYDDLLQVACMGLLLAIDRFDPTAGTPFVAFAKPTILGELKRHLRDKVWTVRIPRPLHDRIGQIERVVEEIALATGRPPSVEQIAAHLGIESTAVLEALEADRDRRMVSLDAPASEEDGGMPRVETIGRQDSALERLEDRATTAAAMLALDAPERELLRMRFVEDLSQREIAARLGRSQMYVSRRLRSTLDQVREAAAEPSPAEPAALGTQSR